MVQASPTLPPRVGVRLGDHVLDAVPVLLRGHEAALVIEQTPREQADVCVVVDWEDGRTTELVARIRTVDGDGRIAHVDVQRVDGDWKPFLEYLGSLTD